MRWKLVFALVCSCLLTAGLQAQLAAGPLETTSLIGVKLYGLPDDGTIATAQQALAGDAKNPALALKLSQAQAGRRQYVEAIATDTAALAASPENAALYLERGHRELGLRQFPAAQQDLERAAKLDPQMLDVFYHLGLSHYFQGHFQQAGTALAKARALAKTDDSLIDCSAWLYNAYSRAGMKAEAAEVLSRITPMVKNSEPHLFFYLQLLHFYQGKITAGEILPPPPVPGDTESALSFNTISYGIGNWDLTHSDKAKAMELFKGVVGDEAWNSWGFVGSEVELARK